ncbi:MAG: hypothetical protein CVT99_16130 [Bacteroidetes bacterium HGW-Bacteroidetes-16]|jgi:hypothetical protein|nr:MAG: hypothetical protein CVT99_16130 [Bacteroidetes bacterium HGW-Bacteroidetes-16]
MKKILVIFMLSFVFLTGKIYSQIALSYYPFQSVLSVSSNTDKLLWADLRIETNTFFSNINLEFNAMVNLKRTDWVNYYSGLGINVNPFYGLEDLPFTNGTVLCAGVRIKPVQKHKNLQVVFELSPYFNKYFDGGMVRTLLGISYNL